MESLWATLFDGSLIDGRYEGALHYYGVAFLFDLYRYVHWSRSSISDLSSSLWISTVAGSSDNANLWCNTDFHDGVAETVSFRWSRSTLLDDSSRLWITYSDGSPINYHYSGAFGRNGVAYDYFLVVE